MNCNLDESEHNTSRNYYCLFDQEPIFRIRSNYIKKTRKLSFSPSCEIIELIKAARKNKAVIAGGFAYNLYIGLDFQQKLVRSGDIDIFCSNDESYHSMVNHRIFLSKNSKKRLYSEVSLGGFVVQIIKPSKLNFKNINNLLDHFDFTCCRCAILDINQNNMSAEFLIDKDIKNNDKDLKDINIKSVNSVERLISRLDKYLHKGYTIDTGHLSEILTKIHNLKKDCI